MKICIKIFAIFCLFNTAYSNFNPISNSTEICCGTFSSCTKISYYSAKQCCKLCGGPTKPHKYINGRCIYDPFYDIGQIDCEGDESLAAFYTHKAWFNFRDCCEFCGFIPGDYEKNGDGCKVIVILL